MSTETPVSNLDVPVTKKDLIRALAPVAIAVGVKFGVMAAIRSAARKSAADVPTPAE